MSNNMYTISQKTNRIVKATPESKIVFEIPKTAKKWRDVAPMSSSTRNKLHNKCASAGHKEQCFLDIRKSKTGKMIFKYPICSGVDCKVQCIGVKAAHAATFRVENKFQKVSKTDPVEYEHAQKEIAHVQKIRREAIKILKAECMRPK